jgi:hypothetical protein
MDFPLASLTSNGPFALPDLMRPLRLEAALQLAVGIALRRAAELRIGRVGLQVAVQGGTGEDPHALQKDEEQGQGPPKLLPEKGDRLLDHGLLHAAARAAVLPQRRHEPLEPAGAIGLEPSVQGGLGDPALIAGGPTDGSAGSPQEEDVPRAVRERVVEEILDLLVPPVRNLPWIHDEENLCFPKDFYTAEAGAPRVGSACRGSASGRGGRASGTRGCQAPPTREGTPIPAMRESMG